MSAGGTSPNSPVSKGVLGWFFGVVLVLLVGVAAYFVVWVVSPMTKPTKMFDDIATKYAESTQAGKPDPMTIDLVIMLEYANANIRTAVVQITFALVGGLLFAAIGVLLIAAAATGAITFGAKTDQGEFGFKTAAPGVACLLFGAIIMGIGVFRDVSRPFAGEVTRPMGVRYSSGTTLPGPARPEGTDPAVSNAEEKQKEGARKSTLTAP